MRDPTSYSHSSKAGPFWLILRPDGKWHSYFAQEELGEQPNAEAALQELLSSPIHWPSCGNPASFGLSDALWDWTPHWTQT